MTLASRLVLALAALALAAGCSHASPAVSAPSRPVATPKLVLISVDGMRPDFYMRPEYRKVAPTIARLADEGEKAPTGIRPIFPSITYPNHIAMVTGAYSAEHGIYNNRIFSPTEGPTDKWNWYESAIKVPTLWQVAEKEGLKVALFRWPASTGARVSWLIPEIFAGNKGFDAVADWDVLKNNTDRDFMSHVLSEGAVKVPHTMADMDLIDVQAVEWVMHNENPDVILLHLVNADYTQHQYGTDSPRVMEAIHGIDADIARILSLLDPKKTTVILASDHGFATYTRFVNLAPLIRAAGLFEEVVAQTDGGQAAIYAKPGGKPLSPEHQDVCGILARTAGETEKHLITAISRRMLDKLHAYPGALCAVEPKMGTAFGYRTSASIVDQAEHPRGHHGWLPSHREMRAGFVIWGKGLSHPGKPLDPDQDIQMPDIAPTAAEILGISFSTPAGTAIRF